MEYKGKGEHSVAEKIELLKDWIKTGIITFDGGNREDDTLTLLNQIQKELAAESKQGSYRWVSVKDGLPEIAITVCLLIKNLNGTFSGFRAKGGWYVFLIGEEQKQYIPDGKINIITHWMPLPPAPNSKSKPIREGEQPNQETK